MTRKISVIISTYNRSKLLDKAINSVLNQSYKDFELIVVDDCSTDDTEKVIRKYPVIHLKTEKNSGSDALPKNLAISKAQGEYVAFLDDDDIWRPDTLKILLRYIETGADVAYGDYLIEEGGRMRPGWSIDFNPPLLSKMNYISMVTAMVKKSALLEVGGFNENLKIFKDWNLWVRMQKRGFKFLHIPIITAEVFPQKESVSEKNKTRQDEEGNFIPNFSPADCEIFADKTFLGEKKPLKVAVFTLTKNRLEYTKRMSEKMFALAGHPFDWFVIDNGSADGTVEWLKTQKVKVIENPKNVGIARGWNQAIELIKKAGGYSIIVKLDNDAEMMSDNWLKTLVELFDRNRKLILSPYVEGLEDSPGGVLRQRMSEGSPYVLINDRVLGMVPFLGGICWAAPIELYDDFKFDEKTFIAGNKDYLISQYANQQGYKCFYAEELRLWHIDGTKGQKEKNPAYFKEIEKARKTKGGIF